MGVVASNAATHTNTYCDSGRSKHQGGPKTPKPDPDTAKDTKHAANSPVGAIRMRVGFFIALYHPAIGGAEAQAALQARKLSERGVSVEVVTSKLPGTALHEDIDGIQVRRIPYLSGSSWLPAKRIIRFAQVIRTSWRSNRYDVVHVHGASDYFSVAALLAARSTNARSVLKIACSGDWLDVAVLRRQLILGRLLLRAARRADRTIAINSDMTGALLDYGFERDSIVEIPNGVELPPQQTESEKHGLRTALRLPADLPIVVYSGSLTPRKNVEALVDAISIMKDRGTECHLLLVGDGGSRRDIERRVHEGGLGEAVTFTGFVRDVRSYLRAADIFALPSLAEGLSNSVLEAMSVGLPCVVTSVPGNTDLVDDGRTGYLVPPRDQNSLASALERALGDPVSASSVGARARDMVKRRYSIDSTVDQLLETYDSLLSRTPVAGHAS